MDAELKYKIMASVAGTSEVEQLKKQFKDLNGESSTLKDKFTSLTNAGKLLAGAFAVREFVSFVQGIIEVGDQIEVMTEKTGIAASALYGYKVAAETTNTNLEALGTGFRKLAVNSIEAKNGNKEMLKYFQDLGVTVTESNGKLKPTNVLIEQLADKFKNFKDGPEKAALAVKIFGKSGTDMIPFLNQGSEALKEFSLAVGDEFADRADEFNDSIARIKGGISNGFTEAVNQAMPAFQEIINAFSDADNNSNLLGDTLQFLAEVIRDIVIIFEPFSLVIRQGADTIYLLAKGAIEFLIEKFNILIVKAKQSMDTLASFASGDFDITKISRKANEEIEKIERDSQLRRVQQLDDYFNRVEKRNENSINRIAKLSENSFLFSGKSIDQAFADQQKSTAPNKKKSTISPETTGGENLKKNEDEKDKIAKFVLTQTKQIEARKEELESIQYTKFELEKLKNAREIDAKVNEDSIGMSEANKKIYSDVAEEIKKEKDALVDLKKAQEESFSQGAKEAMKDYADAAANNAAQMKKVFSDAFNQMEDAFVNFAKTGQLSFKNMANAIIEDLMRIAVRKSIVSGISAVGDAAFAMSSFSMSANGNVIDGSGPKKLSMFANGGVVNSPHVAIFGEGSTPEAFVPLPDGRTIPVTMKSSGQESSNSSGGNVVVNINMESGNTSTEGSTDNLKTLGNIIGQKIREELITQKRPGGLLYS